MNTVLKAIAERRCVREYESRPVPRDTIEAIDFQIMFLGRQQGGDSTCSYIPDR